MNHESEARFSSRLVYSRLFLSGHP